MEIILKDDVKGLGYKNDIVTVKSGYGRNFLLPQGLAMLADKTNKKITAENVRQAAHKADKIKGDAQAIADQIGDAFLEIRAKVGESGKIFGRVTTLQLAEALKAKGVDVDRKRLSFDQEPSAAGDYTATANLHKEVKQTINFRVVAE
ncbi:MULTISPECIES: 50S ribosomal protein L9 [Hymenobacter]|jgi:large subunit ribosomal protein L9|uniref:Large ribosomal subunit protein bL9 n=2 Tax=Hymenobacter TaxID=89966 RepID=A0A1I6AX66_HYMAR|nr:MULTISPECIES: 50S ribosomal protein L9 [Hymenobacter]MCC3152658.1 50S ribosomal protein L9 [Hymenobacter sp. BT770]MDO3414731.1 50S ribosomal protein L9 [Hymenobacter sp. BT770]SFQ73282.1 LSU ribosomal protein L9P [Hymenobacter arizonensis]